MSTSSSSSNSANPGSNNISVKLRPKGSVQEMPPAIIGSSLKLFGFTLGQLLATGLSLCVFSLYMLGSPWPEEFKFKIVGGVALGMATFGYLLLPFGGAAGRTGLEWTIAIISWRRGNIPRYTKARPVQNWQQFKNYKVTTDVSKATLIPAKPTATTSATNFAGAGAGGSTPKTIVTAAADSGGDGGDEVALAIEISKS